MRHLIQIIEAASESYYSTSAVWLHGGPEKLEGGHLRRSGRNGRDMGGLFFAKESPAGWNHAAHYAVLRGGGKPSGVWRCRIRLPDDQVLDFTNETHRARLQAVMGTNFEKLVEFVGSPDGHLPWFRTPETQAAMEQFIRKAGFGGCVILERSGAAGPILSVCVFDPDDIEIIDFVPKADALRRTT